MRTPYFHLEGYTERYWLVPFPIAKGTPAFIKEDTGCYSVCFFKRPIAWIFQKLGIAIRIHKILRSDNGRDFHNHPWNFISVILKGCYFEVTPKFDENGFYQGENKTFYTDNDVLFRQHKHFHRLQLLVRSFYNEKDEYAISYMPVWTLFITFRKRCSWGFMQKPYGITPHFLYKDKD